jgi:hypothetical protein
MELVIKVNPGDNSVQKKGLSLIDPCVIRGACHETSKDECSLSKIAEGSKDRPFVCIKNHHIFGSHSLFKCKRQRNKGRNKKEAPSKL